MMSSLNSCEQYDCNEITWADLNTGAELHSISSYEEVTDADESGLSSCSNLESVCSISSYEEVTDADGAYLDCARSGLLSCPDNASQKKRAFSKVTLTRDRKRLKPIDGEVECLLLDSELSCSGDYNNVVII
jgi:hypothetical protein